MTQEIYKFIIKKGEQGRHKKILNVLKSNYSPAAMPLPSPKIPDDNTAVWSTTDKNLLTELISFGSIMELEEYKDLLKGREQKTLMVPGGNDEYSKFYSITETGGIAFYWNDIAKYLTDKYHARIITEKKYMFIYDFRYNIYKIDYGSTMETEINKMFGDLVNMRITSEIMSKVWQLEERQVDRNSLSWDNSHYINFVNGVLNIKTMKLHKHDPEKYFFRSIIPHKYDVEAKCPNMLELLGRIFDKDEIEHQLEWIGFCLTPGYNFKMIMFYIGLSNSGKSTYFNLLEHLVGKDNTRHVVPQDLKTSYNLAELHGKMINIGADIGNEKIKHFNILRALSGGDMQTAREIYKTPFDFINEAKLMFGCNEIPEFDNIEASYNRVKIVICKNVFTQDDIVKFDISAYKTEEEMSGLINEAIRAYKNTLERGGFIKVDSGETEYIHDLMVNRFWAWSKERLVWCNDNNIMWMHELCLDYNNWCKKNNLIGGMKQTGFTVKFRKEFRDIFYTEEKMRGPRKNQRIAVLGVRRKNTLRKPE